MSVQNNLANRATAGSLTFMKLSYISQGRSNKLLLFLIELGTARNSFREV